MPYIVLVVLILISGALLFGADKFDSKYFHEEEELVEEIPSHTSDSISEPEQQAEPVEPEANEKQETPSNVPKSDTLTFTIDKRKLLIIVLCFISVGSLTFGGYQYYKVKQCQNGITNLKDGIAQAFTDGEIDSVTERDMKSQFSRCLK